MKRGSSDGKTVVTLPKMSEVINFSIPPALAEHLCRLAMDKTENGGKLPLSIDLYTGSDATQMSGTFNAPVNTADPTSISQLSMTFGSVGVCECSVCQPCSSIMMISGKVGWNAVFDDSANEEIAKLPKSQLNTKKKKEKESDQITHQASTLKEEALNKRLLNSDTVRRPRNSNTTSRRGRGARTSTSQRNRSPVIPPPTGSAGALSPIYDHSSSSSTSSSHPVMPMSSHSPGSGSITPLISRDLEPREPRLSTLRMAITNRDDYERCCSAYSHFCTKAQSLRRALLDEGDDARSQFRKLNDNTVSESELTSLIESVKHKRERISNIRAIKDELKEITDALIEGKKRMLVYGRGSV